ncbi:MAG TPA: PPOX class F420-dependent oxidoreductase [Dehalococcoidia bacterium]|jgi:PPOX class probable F420-dependent enzyme|nr:PPOX class F420-dependent oxidoreductase [Dehalococcoidia bacterium]
MGVPLSDGAKRIIDKKNFAHIATIMKDGSPQVSPVWVYRHGDEILVSTGVDRVKTRNIERDPRVALSIADIDQPFPPVQIRGRVVEIVRGEAAVDGFVEVTKKYTGSEPAQRPPAGDRVVYRIEADSVVAPEK